MPRAIAELAAQMLRNPAKVSVTPAASTVDRVEQRILHVDRAAKPVVLAEILRRESIDRALVFTRTKHGADKVVRGLAAAGIDVDGISHVVNFDLPNVPETYVHRIGRTARAGAAGVAISLCDAEEAAYLRDIEKLIRMSIPATDHRRFPRRTQPSTTQSRSARPSAHAPG